MFKLLRYPIFLGLLGSFFISSGMVLQHILPYSPSIGWISFKQEKQACHSSLNLAHFSPIFEI
ncbi:hypothetical protein A6279_18460 [Bacillus wiedmannii]|uniref:hypothetical protein n=1 Tax=Bacillus TaxID=1386 RepID=UPI0007989610|nr:MULTISPECIES: hypothetical protein [Bacillus]KAA0779611.1 hypothetical protein DN392_00200 [Bacillus sp. BB51/4]KXY04505.1 hypothetical protein AT260_01415 [Bacillus wiedmannii]OAK15280.1 hypothetical protein A6278_17290 [Bacillus wiedmannii]OAK15468.1 hypothetical protein A6279_18460 [Bacillus wiedmannii]OAK45774.1 hypothetical protein A6286_21500 [Bacillus wiedmannii]